MALSRYSINVFLQTGKCLMGSKVHSDGRTGGFDPDLSGLLLGPEHADFSTPACPDLTLQSGHGTWPGQLAILQPRLLRIRLYGFTGVLRPPCFSMSRAWLLCPSGELDTTQSGKAHHLVRSQGILHATLREVTL